MCYDSNNNDDSVAIPALLRATSLPFESPPNQLIRAEWAGISRDPTFLMIISSIVRLYPRGPGRVGSDPLSFRPLIRFCFWTPFFWAPRPKVFNFYDLRFNVKIKFVDYQQEERKRGRGKERRKHWKKRKIHRGER